MKFEVGDMVFLSPESEFATGEDLNPVGIQGTVVPTDAAVLPLRVRWNNGTTNAYNEKDLLPVTKLAKAIYGDENERI